MSAGVAAASYSQTSLPNQWLDWLHHHVDTDWRPGQWIHGSWLFTGTPDDPTTTVDICHVQACETLVGNQRLCKLDKSPGLVGFREPGVTAPGLLAGVSLPG
jgi:hypothetical protein